MSKCSEIRDFLGDYAFEVEYSEDNKFTMFFNSERNVFTFRTSASALIRNDEMVTELLIIGKNEIEVIESRASIAVHEKNDTLGIGSVQNICVELDSVKSCNFGFAQILR